MIDVIVNHTHYERSHYFLYSNIPEMNIRLVFLTFIFPTLISNHPKYSLEIFNVIFSKVPPEGVSHISNKITVVKKMVRFVTFKVTLCDF